MRLIALDVHRDFCEVAIAEGRQCPCSLGGCVTTPSDARAVRAEASRSRTRWCWRRPGTRSRSPGSSSRTSLASCSPTRRRSRARRSGPKTDKIDAQHAREVARCRLSARGMGARRADARAASADRPPRAARQAAHAGEKPGARDPDPQPQPAPANERSVRRRRSPLAFRSDASRGRAGDGRSLPASDLLPRHMRSPALTGRSPSTRSRSPAIRRLMTLPGISFVTAAALLGAIGDVSRFPTAGHLVSYLGLDPRVRQSGSEPARHGRISKQGPGRGAPPPRQQPGTRRTTGPLRAFGERIASGAAQDRRRRYRPQAGRYRLAHAQPRRGRLRPPLARA